MNHRRVEECVEILCRKGCQSVWGDIDALEHGRPVAEAVGLSRSEISAVIEELKSVMAVYEGSCIPG